MSRQNLMRTMTWPHVERIRADSDDKHREQMLLLNGDTILIRQAVRQFIDRAQAVDLRGEEFFHARDSNRD